jgi:hypothetical protein
MPQSPQNSMKGTSPSKAIQHGVDTDWAAQTKTSTTAQEALAKKHTESDSKMPVSGSGN